MPQQLLKRKDIVKKLIYNPQELIATAFSAVQELLDFHEITRTSYTQDQAVHISYVILHRTGKFGLAIQEWNHMTIV